MAFNFNVISNSYSDYDTPEECDRLGAGDGNGRGWGEADSIGTNHGKGNSYSGCCGDGDGDGDGDDNGYGNSISNGRGRSDIGGIGGCNGDGISYGYGGNAQTTLATAIKAVSKGGTTLTPQQYNQLVARAQRQAKLDDFALKVADTPSWIVFIMISVAVIAFLYLAQKFNAWYGI